MWHHGDIGINRYLLNCFENILNELKFSLYKAMDKCIDIQGKRKEPSLSDKSVPAKKLTKASSQQLFTILFYLLQLE